MEQRKRSGKFEIWNWLEGRFLTSVVTGIAPGGSTDGLSLKRADLQNGAARRRLEDAVQRVGNADLIRADTFSAAAFTVVLLSVKMLRSGVVRPYTASVR